MNCITPFIIQHFEPQKSQIDHWPTNKASLFPSNNSQLLCFYFQMKIILWLSISWRPNLRSTQKQNKQLARLLLYFQEFYIKFKCYSRFTAIQIKLTFRKKMCILSQPLEITVFRRFNLVSVYLTCVFYDFIQWPIIS